MVCSHTNYILPDVLQVLRPDPAAHAMLHLQRLCFLQCDWWLNSPQKTINVNEARGISPKVTRPSPLRWWGLATKLGSSHEVTMNKKLNKLPPCLAGQRLLIIWPQTNTTRSDFYSWCTCVHTTISQWVVCIISGSHISVVVRVLLRAFFHMYYKARKPPLEAIELQDTWWLLSLSLLNHW